MARASKVRLSLAATALGVLLYVLTGADCPGTKRDKIMLTAVAGGVLGAGIGAAAAANSATWTTAGGVAAGAAIGTGAGAIAGSAMNSDSAEEDEI